MKKILKIVLIILILSLFCSCSRTTDATSHELKNRLIILALGIDKAESGQILVSVQTLNTDVSSNASSQGAPESMVKNYTQKGVSISDAIAKLSDITGKNPLLSQNRIVVFGWELANDGLSDYLDDFIRNTENRSSVIVSVAQGKAQEVVFAEVGENVIPARIIERIIESSSHQSCIQCTRVYELINGIIDEKSCPTVPIVRVSKSEKEDRLRVDSIGIIKGDRLDSVKSLDMVQGIIFVRNRAKKGMITMQYDASEITLSIIKSKTKTKTYIKDGKPYFEISINTSVSVSEINDSITDKKNNLDLKNIEYAAEQRIKEYIENSVNECIMKDKSDVFGFGKRLMRTQPKYFKTNIKSWADDMDMLGYSVEVNVKLRGMGDSAAILHG